MGEQRKVAIVTGAGQGIGAAIALKLADEGYAVAIAEYNADNARAVADAIKAKGGLATAFQTDVSNEESVQSMVRLTVGEFGRIDGLVNNAGIYPKSLIVDMSKKEWDRVLAVNLKGAYLCCKYVLSEMISRHSGKIVNLASGHAFRGGPAFSHYAASKAGIVAMTKSIALEVARFGIQANVVAPGTADTTMPRQHSTEEQMRVKAQGIPMGRLTKPEDVAEAVAYLLSDHNTFITGQTICVNGGAVML